MAWYPMAKHHRVKIILKATSYSACAFQASSVQSTILIFSLNSCYKNMYNELDCGAK